MHPDRYQVDKSIRAATYCFVDAFTYSISNLLTCNRYDHGNSFVWRGTPLLTPHISYKKETKFFYYEASYTSPCGGWLPCPFFQQFTSVVS